MIQNSAAQGKKALIIGAGTAGMASAITLSRIGIEIDIIDINPNWGALGAGLKLIHLTAAPVAVEDISQQGFSRPFTNVLNSPTGYYDMQSKHAEVFGGVGRYQYSARETIQAVRAYAQSESLTIKPDVGAKT